MSLARVITLSILVVFSLLSGYALLQSGYKGIWHHLTLSPQGWQVFADLAIALGLVLLWLIPHARQHGRSPWPWVTITLMMGSFGPLFYLLIYNPYLFPPKPMQQP